MKAGHMSLRRENTAPPRFYGTSPAKRQPRASFTPPQQRAHHVIRRGSLGVIQSNSAEKKLLFSKRSNSLGGANDDYSPTKLDFQSLKKRPSLLGTGKLKSGNKETEAVSNRAEKHSMVILGAGGVGKTGKHSNLALSLKSLQTFKRKHICILKHNLELHSSSEGHRQMASLLNVKFSSKVQTTISEVKLIFLFSKRRIIKPVNCQLIHIPLLSNPPKSVDRTSATRFDHTHFQRTQKAKITKPVTTVRRDSFCTNHRSQLLS